MKNSVIKFAGVILLFVLLAFTFTGCDVFERIFSGGESENKGANNENPGGEIGNHSGNRDFYPEGYTGGLMLHSLYEGPVVEYKWVETYEELCGGIELLKSHGSTFNQQNGDFIPAIECDNLAFDIKYVFVITGEEQCRKYGEEGNFFDRKLEDVSILTYIFFDDVTIDELEFSHIGNYDSYYLSVANNLSNKDFDTDSLRYEYCFANLSNSLDNPEYEAAYYLYSDDITVMQITSKNFDITEEKKISEENMLLIIDSVCYLSIAD